MTASQRPTLSVRTPADLIAAVPYLLGFHPADSLVVVGVRGTRLVFAARYDLPGPDEPPPAARDRARHVAGVVTRQGVDAVTVLGYGPAARVTPGVATLTAALTAARLTVLDELRVTDGRFWSYRCVELSCCPVEGTPCAPEGSAVAAAATFAGQVALPDRAALAAGLAPVQPSAVRVATVAAERRRDALLAGRSATAGPADAALRRAGWAAVREAMARHRGGGWLTADEAAWLGVLLTHLPVRDRAWELIGAQDWHVGLWTDVVRQVRPVYVVAPACLLAFAAWRTGQGALASVALDRAREQDPDYSMATLLDEVLRHGLPPDTLPDRPDAGSAVRRRVARRRRRRELRR